MFSLHTQKGMILPCETLKNILKPPQEKLSISIDVFVRWCLDHNKREEDPHDLEIGINKAQHNEIE